MYAPRKWVLNISCVTQCVWTFVPLYVCVFLLYGYHFTVETIMLSRMLFFHLFWEFVFFFLFSPQWKNQDRNRKRKYTWNWISTQRLENTINDFHVLFMLSHKNNERKSFICYIYLNIPSCSSRCRFRRGRRLNVKMTSIEY